MARISTGTMTVGIFAVLFGLVGAYALRASLTRPAPDGPPPPRTVNVPLASSAIPAGRRLTLGDMVLVPMTQEDMRGRNYPLEQLMIDTNQIVGRMVQKDLKPGDPFLTASLYAEGTGPKLADKLKPGMRAVTIPIDNLSAVGGSTVEGSFVDVLFRARMRPADALTGKPEIPSTTVTLLENVEVLAVARVDVGARRGRDEGIDLRDVNQQRPAAATGNEPIVSVTIAVTPDQANIIKAVLGQGDMSLALRGDKAANNVTPNKYTLEGILGIQQAAANRSNRTEIFRGSGMRQNLVFFDDHVAKDEVSLVPGISSGMQFPVPATVPASQDRSRKSAPTYQPSPRVMDVLGNGYGTGYGAGYNVGTDGAGGGSRGMYGN
jgi:pilus assembly protein CpaB